MNQLIEISEIILSLGVKAFKAKSIKHLVVIFIIFAISGSVAVFIRYLRMPTFVMFLPMLSPTFVIVMGATIVR